MTKRDESISKLILELVPGDGQPITNRKLLAALLAQLGDISEDEYLRVREQLIEEGHLLKASGRGGSVRLASEGAIATGKKPVARTSRRKTASQTSTSASPENEASAYQHEAEAVQRPDAGIEAQFSHHKPPKSYRYDSSLAPELSWDENADRSFAEWLINLAVEAASKGKDTLSGQNIGRGGVRI